MIYEKRHMDCRDKGHVLTYAGKEWRSGDLGQLPDGIVVQLVHWCQPRWSNPTWYWEQMSDEYGYDFDANPERLL